MNSNTSPKESQVQSNLCLGKEERVLQYLTASPGCSEDIAAVHALPEQWKPSSGGPILLNYLKQREQSHFNALKDLQNDSNIINEEINSKVRTLAELLLADIQQSENDIDCVIDKCKVSQEPLTQNDHKKALAEKNILISRRIQALRNFKLEALAIERDRVTKLKTKLQIHFQRLINIGHRSPKQLLHEFDESIYDINQQLLSNCRTNMALEKKLCSQADQNLVQARTALNKILLDGKTSWWGKSANPWPLEPKNDNRPISAIESGLRKSYNMVNAIDRNHEFKSPAKLVETYRDAIFKMYKEISDQLDKLYQEIENHNIGERKCCLQSPITGIQTLIEKSMQSLGLGTLSDVLLDRDVIELLRSSIINMQKSLSTFGENLKDTYTILHDASHLWDAHMVRLALAQKLTVATVEDLIASHDATELFNEVVTNIALEQLRGAPDSDKLQQYHDVIGIGLDRSTDLYSQHSVDEIGRLEEFYSLNSSLANTLLSECNSFLERYPRLDMRQIIQTANTQKIESPKDTISSERLIISKAIFQTYMQNVALCNWRNGFLETFETNLSTVSEQLYRQIQLWVDERIEILRNRHLLKLMSNNVRKERIQVARELRLSELLFHEARLNSHLDAIYDLVDNLPTEASEFMNLDAPELYPLSWWLSRIQTDINELLARDTGDPEVKRLKMCSYASRLTKYRQHFSDSLDCATERYKKSIEHRVQEARISNMKFMSQLKLFSEGGKYAPIEATKTCTALVKGADALELCFSRTLDCLHHRRTQLLSQADQQITPIQKIVDDILKNAPKGFLDKKKIATGKK